MMISSLFKYNPMISSYHNSVTFKFSLKQDVFLKETKKTIKKLNEIKKRFFFKLK